MFITKSLGLEADRMFLVEYKQYVYIDVVILLILLKFYITLSLRLLYQFTIISI